MLKPLTLWVFLAIVGVGMYYVQTRRHILPNEFKIYIKPNGKVSSNPSLDSTAKILPTPIDYEGFYGCYLACYSSGDEGIVYSIAQNTNVVGVIRVEGQYKGSKCIAYAYQDEEGKGEPDAEGLAALCRKHFPQTCAGNSCWAKGDTGHWFNLKD